MPMINESDNRSLFASIGKDGWIQLVHINKRNGSTKVIGLGPMEQETLVGIIKQRQEAQNVQADKLPLDNITCTD